MYSQKALDRRQCVATRKDGAPCAAFACWDDARGRCVAHAGRLATGPRKKKRRIRWTRERFFAAPVWSRGRYVPCTCRAYAYPHRPGGGVCCWPDVGGAALEDAELEDAEVGSLRALREDLARRVQSRR